MTSAPVVVLNTTKTTLLVLAGLGLGFAGLNLKEKIVKQIKGLLSKKPTEEFKKRLENLPEKELAQEFKKVLACYNKEFEDSKILEKIIERKIDSESQIGKLASNFTYTYDDNSQEDLVSVNTFVDH